MIDSEGSLELRILDPIKAGVLFRIPVELGGKDVDGVEVHVLLHVVDGMSREIEIYKDSPDPILTLPSEWNTVVYGPDNRT